MSKVANGVRMAEIVTYLRGRSVPVPTPTIALVVGVSDQVALKALLALRRDGVVVGRRNLIRRQDKRFPRWEWVLA